MYVNLLYPGRPNYEGPVQGFFGLLHHSIIAEWSDNVMERVDYVKNYKSKNEVEIRLWNMCYLSEERLPKEFVEAWKTLEEARTLHYEAYKTWEKAANTYDKVWKTWGEVQEVLQTFSPLLLPLIKELVPNTAWNGQELVF